MSGKNLLTKFDELVKRFKNEFDEIVVAERAKMKAEVEAFNEEKKQMQAFVVRDDDVIHLNVGGQKFTTERSTLCQVEGSLFATMFSGRWEDNVKRDEDGAVYFDFNPQYFAVILDYLRAKKIATAENPAAVPKIPKDQVKNFNNLVEYLGLSDEILPDEKFNLHSPGVTLEEDGKVAVHDGTDGHKYVLGENIYRQGTVSLKLKLESFKDDNWMFIGIVKEDAVRSKENSWCWRGVYGWTLGLHNPASYKDGYNTTEKSLTNLTKQGDEVKLTLDFDAAKLSLDLPTGQQSHIDIPKDKTWRLNVNLFRPNDKIRIVNE